MFSTTEIVACTYETNTICCGLLQHVFQFSHFSDTRGNDVRDRRLPLWNSCSRLLNKSGEKSFAFWISWGWNSSPVRYCPEPAFPDAIREHCTMNQAGSLAKPNGSRLNYSQNRSVRCNFTKVMRSEHEAGQHKLDTHS
jgi:hypothetical protein